jgi:single-stranded DNA-binding protein
LLYSANLTAVYSNKYWSQYSKQTKNPDWKLVIAYDTAGAIIGFYFGKGNLAYIVAFAVLASLDAF